ncbi:MAG: AAA family ATPase [Bacteroidales bacterium]
MIKNIKIKNFRGIKDIEIEVSRLNLFIGDNATSKTSILEAINYALSPAFLSGRIKHTDFYNGNDNEIVILLEFDDEIKAKLPDGYVTQEVSCNKISLTIKKREKRSPGKTFSDLVTTNHILLPNFERGEEGWKVKRKNGRYFTFNERILTLSQIDADNLYRSFYFGRGREKQLQKGFNSSFNTIIDDFNWRFDRAIRKSDNSQQNSIQDDIEKVELEIHKTIELDKQEVIKNISKRLEIFGIGTIDIKLLDSMAPYDNSFLGLKKGNLYLPVKYLGSGIEMIYSLIFLETLASFSKENLVILIDEPELHLHPKLQEKLSNYLIELSKNHQIFVTTHSPIFFKNCLGKDGVKNLITIKESDSIKIEEKNINNGLFPWSPSWGEINYFAYDYPTIEFHNELYGYLQELSEQERVKDFDNWLSEKGISKDKKWILPGKDDKEQKKSDYVTLPTFIRNKIHHPENKTMKDCNFNDEDLKKSIETMIKLLQQK